METAALNKVGNTVNLIKIQEDFSSFIRVVEAGMLMEGTERVYEAQVQDVKQVKMKNVATTEHGLCGMKLINNPS